MKQIKKTSIRVLEERLSLIWLLAWKGFGDTDIGEIMGIERSWVYRLRKRKPKGWKPDFGHY